ncbi:MAG: serine--tRNA ligase [Minisyncoccales bacterium]
MLDIKFIRENKDLLKKTVKNKGVDLDIDKLLGLDKERRELIQKSENIKSQQKKLGKKDRVKAGELKEEFKKINNKLKEVKEKYNDLMLLVPNIPSDDTPVGLDESGNKEISKWGKIPKFSFQIKNHIQLGKELDLIDIEKGVKTSGFRGYYLKNEAVLIQMALMWHALLKLKEKGFQLMIPPTLAREFVLVGSGHFPEAKDEVFQVANPGKLSDGKEISEPMYLGGTSEPSLLAYYVDNIFNEDDLPIKLAGFSQCYRSEVGSYGKDTHGLYRLHEFMKVEQVVFCEATLKKADKLFEEMRENCEEILQELELPYRVIQICTGDMGAGKYKMYDIETWMPSHNKYGETHSNSNLTDWQARRLNIKYKTKNKERKFVYTLNNTMIASPRILIAILENFQQKDGSILIPEVLQKYLGSKIISKK